MRWARLRHGATRVYVKVEKDNAASFLLRGKVGFAPHYDYHYRIGPS